MTHKVIAVDTDTAMAAGTTLSSTGDDVAAFERLTTDIYINGNVGLALALAMETGVVEVLCQAEEPLSSGAIAKRKELRERYVRELVNCLTSAGLVQLQAGTGGIDGIGALYLVPATHRHSLTKAGTTCLALSSAARRFAAVRDCFDLHGPICVRYEKNHFDFLDKMSALKVNKVIEAMLSTPGLKTRLESGLQAAEVGCGSGRLFCTLAAMFPQSTFTLTDMMPEPLERARERAESEGLTNTRFHLLDICHIPQEWEERIDWLVADAVLHDLPHPLTALRGLLQMLKPGGNFSMVDIFVSSYVAPNTAQRSTAALYAQGTFSCLPESYQQPDSEALGPCWGKEKAMELLHEAGFEVLGMAKSVKEDMGPMAVCMCQKPD